MADPKQALDVLTRAASDGLLSIADPMDRLRAAAEILTAHAILDAEPTTAPNEGVDRHPLAPKGVTA